MFDEIKAKVKQLREQAETNSINKISEQAADIAQTLKAIEEHDFHELSNKFSELVKLAVDVYDAIGWDLRELNNYCANNAALKNALSDSILFYERLSQFLQTIFNTPVITKKLIHDTQQKLTVDPNYLPNSLPGYLSEPKIGETHAAFERRRMGEHMQARTRGQTIGLSAIRQNELEYKSAIKFAENFANTQKISNHSNPEIREYVAKKIASKYLETYKFIAGYEEQISWKSKTPAQETLSITLQEFANRIQYYDDKERAEFRKFVYDGKLYERDLAGQDAFAVKPTDTTQKSSKGVANYAAFVISSRGEFYAETHLSHDYDASKADIFRFHSSFTSGSYVMSAGEIKTDATGQLLAITNRSGHYHPKLYNLYNAYRFLKDKGVDFSQCAFEYILHTPDGREIASKLTEETFLNYFNAKSQDLYNAIVNGNRAEVQALLKEGATLSEKQLAELKPSIQLYLDELLQTAFNENDFNAVDQYLAKGAQFPFEPKDIAVLHAAAKNVALLEVLHKHNYDLNYTDQNGDTALHIAVAAGNQPAFGFLMNHGLNPLQPNNADITPVKIASSANINLVGNAGNSIVDQENDMVDIPPPPPEPIERMNINHEGEKPLDPKYSVLLHDAIIMLITQTNLPSAGFLSHFLNAAVAILDGENPVTVLPTQNKNMQQEYANFIRIMSEIQAYTRSESIHPSFIEFRKLMETERQKFASIAKIQNPVIQASLLALDYDETANKHVNNDIDTNKLVMASTSVDTLHNILTQHGFKVDPDSNDLDNVFVEIKRTQAINNIDNKTLSKILSKTNINITDEKVIAINKFLSNPDLKHANCNSVLVKTLGVKSFFINEAQFKEILREIKTDYAKNLGLSKEAANDIKQDFVNNSAEISKARQTFKQQRRPNIFKTKRYNLEKLTEIAELLTRKMFILGSYRHTVEKLKLIQASDLALPDVTSAAIHQHENDLKAFEMQVNTMVKLTVEELAQRTTKLFDLAKNIQQRFAKNKKIEKLLADWELQAPFIEKLLASKDQLNDLIKYYKLDAKTESKLINHLNELTSAKETLSSLTKQIAKANKQQAEANQIKLSVEPAPTVIVPFEKQAGKREPINVISPKHIIVPVTEKLSYEIKDDQFSYVRPKDYTAPFVSKEKTYTAEEKLVFEDLSRRFIESFKSNPSAEKRIIRLHGNNDMSRKVAIWLTAINNEQKAINNVTILINNQKFKPKMQEKFEITQKQKAEHQRQKSSIASKRHAIEAVDTNDKTPLLKKRQ